MAKRSGGNHAKNRHSNSILWSRGSLTEILFLLSVFGFRFHSSNYPQEALPNDHLTSARLWFCIGDSKYEYEGEDLLSDAY